MLFFINLLLLIRNGIESSLLFANYKIPSGAPIPIIIAILTILRKNGIIRGFSFKYAKAKNRIIIYLKYDATGKQQLNTLYFVSTPGRVCHITSNSL